MTNNRPIFHSRHEMVVICEHLIDNLNLTITLILFWSPSWGSLPELFTLSLASWVPSTSMTTSGVTFLGGAEVVSELLDVDLVAAGFVAAGWAVWSRRHSHISSSSWEGTSSTFAYKGTDKSTNKSCHLLNYVAWIAGTSGPSRLDRSILPTCLLHIWPVYVCSNHNVLTTSYTDSCTSGCRGSTGTCNSSDIV